MIGNDLCFFFYWKNVYQIYKEDNVVFFLIDNNPIISIAVNSKFGQIDMDMLRTQDFNRFIKITAFDFCCYDHRVSVPNGTDKRL